MNPAACSVNSRLLNGIGWGKLSKMLAGINAQSPL